MALRLAKAFGTSPDLWLRLQVARDLWDARRTRTARVKRLVA
jgi:addiction module HigA family antidote